MALPQTYIEVSDELQAEAFPAPLRLLWLVSVNSDFDIAHGGNLRFFNYGRELLARGHEVYFVGIKTARGEKNGAFLNDLKCRGVISDFFEVEYNHPWLRGKIAHLLTYPGLADLVLRKHQAPVVQAIRELISTRKIDACVISARNALFVLPKINSQVKTVIDWVDSFFLYHFREARMHLKQFRFGRAARALQFMTEAFVRESYYGRRASATIAVSPVDKQYLDFANRAAKKNYVLANGVTAKPAKPLSKIKGRLIFTGNMDFPPNYESALWFIDNVFPLLQERCETRLVIAGANPVKELLARANERIEVTGYVDDIQKEIARSELYVAPLICGGGFKNKVVEAISSGTFVIGTSLATEFLPAETRGYIPTADSPHELAEAILNYLDEPHRFASNLEALRRIVAEQFSWPARAQEFVDIIAPKLRGKVSLVRDH